MKSPIEDLENELHAFVDGELIVAERLVMLERMRREVGLRTRLGELLHLKACVREAYSSIPLPDRSKRATTAGKQTRGSARKDLNRRDIRVQATPAPDTTPAPIAPRHADEPGTWRSRAARAHVPAPAKPSFDKNR